MSEAKSRDCVQRGSSRWIDGEVERYLLTGKYDAFFSGWPGSDFVDAAKQGTQRLRMALLAETARRSADHQLSHCGPNNMYSWSRDRLRPMVYGLFDTREREAVLHLLGNSIVFLTPTSIVESLQSERWLSTAWDLANIYLESLNLPALSSQACSIVGLSQDATCYVSMSYFEETDPFADFVVHEAAHVFHNCRRSTAGLVSRPHSDYLLDIDYRMRETFAWACEAWSQISSKARNRRDRESLLGQHAVHGLPSDDRVDNGEYLDILAEAVKARNGWQRIHSRCKLNRRAKHGG